MSVLEGFFSNWDQKGGRNWRMALICGRSKGVLITVFKKKTDRGILFWP